MDTHTHTQTNSFTAVVLIGQWEAWLALARHVPLQTGSRRLRAALVAKFIVTTHYYFWLIKVFFRFIMHDKRAVAARLIWWAPLSVGCRHGEDRGAKWGTVRQTGQKQTLWITQWAWNPSLRATRGTSCHVQTSCLHWTVRAELTLIHKEKEELVRLSEFDLFYFFLGFFCPVQLSDSSGLSCPGELDKSLLLYKQSAFKYHHFSHYLLELLYFNQ